MKKTSILRFVLLAALYGIIGFGGLFTAGAQTTAALTRDLLILTPGANRSAGDTTQAGTALRQPTRPKAITADSAKIISPALRTVITDCPAVYEIEPMLPVDSALLYVYHSRGQIDTLAVVSSPPYKAMWNCADIPDLDQTHLQFGYVLYRGDSATIVSPPTPHRWALSRDGGADKKGKRGEQPSYRVKPLTATNGFEVDCDTLKWAKVEGAAIAGANGGIATFKMLRTGAKLYFIARVRDSSVNNGDFVELHIDIYRDRAVFPGINHRSLRFAPRGRCIFFVGDYADGKYAPSDSAVQLLTDEAEWKTSVTSDGYVVEAAIPFSLLSNLDSPPTKIGLDVSVMDAGRQGESFYSWAGVTQFTRYSPSRWGTARIDQASPALRYVLLFALFISAFGVLGFVAYLYLSHRQESKEIKAETRGASPLTETVIEQIEKQLSNANLGINDIAKSINTPPERITSALMSDLECTFEQQLTYKRIKHSQKLMRNPELTMEAIAERCGFANVDAYRKSYSAQMKVDPEVSRKAMLERIREDLEAEKDDDDDDDGVL